MLHFSSKSVRGYLSICLGLANGPVLRFGFLYRVLLFFIEATNMITAKISVAVPQEIIDSARADQTMQDMLVKAYISAELEANGFNPVGLFISPQPRISNASQAYFMAVFTESPVPKNLCPEVVALKSASK